MLTGMYISCMGAMVQQARHETTANNLANLNTAGFKPDYQNIMQIPAESVWKGLGRRESDWILEKTGGGAWLDSTSSDFTAGPLKTTNAPMDLALEDQPGKVSFFKIRSGEGEGEQIRYTRNGNFNISTARLLVNSVGMPVLSDANQPITVPPAEQISIDANGNVHIFNNGQRQLVGRIGIATTSAEEAQKGLKKLGDSLFQPKEGTVMEDGTGKMISGKLEQASTNQINEMVSMIEGQRTYEMNMKFLSMQDQTLGSAIQRLRGQ